MTRALSILACVLLVGLIVLAPGVASIAQGSTATYTPSAQFVLPIINATIALPTAFEIIQPTSIPLPPLSTLDAKNAAVYAANFFQDSFNYVRVLLSAAGIFINFFFLAAVINAAFGLLGLWRARLQGISYREWAENKKYRNWIVKDSGVSSRRKR